MKEKDIRVKSMMRGIIIITSSVLLLSQAQAFPILIGGDGPQTGTHAPKMKETANQNAPVSQPKPANIKLTDNQRQQKIYDLYVLYFFRDNKLLKSIDIENLQLNYGRDINSCDTSDCQMTQTSCSDTFTRIKKADSVEMNLPKGVQPLYYDERVCQTTTYSDQ